MLQVILLILKVIGITLAVLVGLILLIVLLILLVPFRYGGSAAYPVKKDESGDGIALTASGKITWLLHFLNISISYDNTGSVVILKVLGIRIVSTAPEDVAKKEEKQRKKREKAKAKRRKRREKEKKKRKTEGKPKTEEKPIAEDKPKTEEKPKTEAKTKTEVKTRIEDKPKTEEKQKQKEKTGEKPKEKSEKKKENRVTGFIKKLGMYKDFSDDYRVRRAFKYIMGKVKTVMKRVLPGKLEGHIHYGFENPATTGKIAGLASLFLGLWGGHVEITPDFENKVIDADVKFKGKIRLAGVGIPALKVWLNRDVKYVRKEFDHLKAGTYKKPENKSEQLS